MIGGFLGAGKTTLVGRLAAHYQAMNKKVVIVTNDQATDLVDTNLLRSQGFAVGEVAGSCFCCNFNALTATVEQLAEDDRPDIILAEPVGSCTDLVATVIRPLEQVYSQPLDIAPYGVIVKPSHGIRILKKKEKAGFSPQAEYIFRKQIEEADFIIINRIDELAPEEVNELASLVEAEYPGRPILRLSALTGEGFEPFCEFLDQQGEFGRRVMDLDYEVYAEGEAELGWLNAQVTMISEQKVNLDDILMSLINRLQQSFVQSEAETAHLKCIGLFEGFYGVANLINNFEPAKLSLPSRCQSKEANIVVNARVAIDPEQLFAFVESAIKETAAHHQATLTIDSVQRFKPGRPVPTHRL